MGTDNPALIFGELTEKILGLIAFKVHNKLGCGFSGEGV